MILSMRCWTTVTKPRIRRWRSTVLFMSEEAFQAMTDELRRAMRIKPFDWPLF